MLTVAPGFTLNATALHPIEIPSPDTARFSEADCRALLDNAGRWLMSLPQPLSLETQPLGNINPLLKEFFIAQAVLAFQARAGSVRPVAALGRIVLIDYEPWQQPDPPVPLLTLTPLDTAVIAGYNRAIRHVLNTGGGRYIGQALPAVLHAGIGKLTRAEAFYVYTKLISLVTGAYTQLT